MASLQEQLLKAGLTTEKKAKKAKKSNKKSRELKREVKASTEAQREQQKQKDRELNQQIKAEADKKAIAAQIKQLIKINLIDEKGEELYKFVDDNVIKQLYVTPLHRKQLLNGVLAVVNYEDDYAVIPTVVADKIRQRDEAVIVSIAEPEEETVVEEDDPYADYVIPDDLMW